MFFSQASQFLTSPGAPPPTTVPLGSSWSSAPSPHQPPSPHPHPYPPPSTTGFGGHAVSSPPPWASDDDLFAGDPLGFLGTDEPDALAPGWPGGDHGTQPLTSAALLGLVDHLPGPGLHGGAPASIPTTAPDPTATAPDPDGDVGFASDDDPWADPFDPLGLGLL